MDFSYVEDMFYGSVFSVHDSGMWISGLESYFGNGQKRETKDFHLKEHKAGWKRCEGKFAMIAMSTKSRELKGLFMQGHLDDSFLLVIV